MKKYPVATVLPLFPPKKMAATAERVAAAEQATNAAVAMVMDNAKETEKSQLLTCVLAVCKHHQEFTSDDVWNALEGVGGKPKERRLMGGVLRKAAGYGWCVHSGRHSKSLRKERHQGTVAIYKSRIYGQA